MVTLVLWFLTVQKVLQTAETLLTCLDLNLSNCTRSEHLLALSLETIQCFIELIDTTDLDP